MPSTKASTTKKPPKRRAVKVVSTPRKKAAGIAATPRVSAKSPANTRKDTRSKISAVTPVGKAAAKAVAHKGYQKTYTEKQREAGLYRATAWIPETRKAEYDKAITRLRKKWAKDAAA
jgi:hypothetical protein